MKNQILLLLTILAWTDVLSAQRKITGTVTGGDEPLIGATVVVPGTATGTITDADGMYSIEVPEGATELQFSYTGYKIKIVSIERQTVINVVMDEGLYINEVIVVGYSAKKRSELVGSSVQVKSEELEQVPVASVDQILQGKVAGLTISATSGTPGSAQNIRIRGISSVTAGNEPLYVIDGVPMSNVDLQGYEYLSSLSSLAALNANDIASVTVLKDASATAVYGARGSNGVIVITTKGGASGKTSINLSSSYGVSNDAIEGPVMLTAAEREMLFYEALYNTYGASEGFDLAGAKAYYEANPSAFGTAYTDWNAAGRPETDWADVITNKNAPQMAIDLSASGGDEKQNFYASLGYYNSEATVIASQFKRYSGSLKYSRSISENIRFDTKNTVANSVQDGILENGAYFSSPRGAKYFMSPLATAYNADGTINIGDIQNYAIFFNPLWVAAHDIHLNKLTRLISNNSISWNTPIPNLIFTTRLNIDFSVSDYKDHFNRTHGDGMASGGLTELIFNKITNYVTQNALDYTLSINRNHVLNFKVLQEFQKNQWYNIDTWGEGFATDGLTNLASASTPKYAYSANTDWAVASYTGLLDYDFANKYILSATYRREGNSRFHADQRWGNFWSVGAAWNIYKEGFFSSIGFVDNLKLRASYGRTGNDAIGLNQYQALFGYSGAYGGTGTVSPSTVGNQVLSWEIADNFETGVDFGVLQNRITGTFSYFRRETKENLFNVPLSLTTGFSSQLRNIGRLQNQGVEMELSVDVIRSKAVNMTIGGNVATVHNKVLELPADANGDPINITNSYNRVETGHSVYEWYMVKFAGVDSQTGENLYFLNEEGTETTNMFNEAKQFFFGKSALPTLTAGMNFHIDFKGFFLDANAYYAGGHMVFEDWTRYTNGTDRWSVDFFNGINSLLQRWQKPGDVTDVSKMTFTAEPWRIYSRFLAEGDYLRVKNITVGYNLPSVLTQKAHIENVKIFARGINLFTWVKDDRMQYDPEVPASGFAVMSTPPVKTMMLGLNFKF